MTPIAITVSPAILEADVNDGLPGAGEGYTHGFYTDENGNECEFLPYQTNECPKCGASPLEEFFVGRADTGDGDHERHQRLVVICHECGYIPFKAEAVKLYPEQPDGSNDVEV